MLLINGEFAFDVDSSPEGPSTSTHLFLIGKFSGDTGAKEREGKSQTVTGRKLVSHYLSLW